MSAAEDEDDTGPVVVIPPPRTSPENKPPENEPPESELVRNEPPENEPPPEVSQLGVRSKVRRLLARRRTAALAVLLALLLGSGGLFAAAQSLNDPAATGNHALTDTAATDRVVGDVSSALSRIFAYAPGDTAATEQAARELLDGTAATQYQALFAQIRTRVAEQQLTLTTRVVRAGVVTLTGSRARLLVFLDQTAQRAGAAATTAAAQLAVTARYEGGRWRITDLKAR